MSRRRVNGLDAFDDNRSAAPFGFAQKETDDADHDAATHRGPETGNMKT
jgi:hypothetical protein